MECLPTKSVRKSMFACTTEPLPLTSRFQQIKRGLVSGKEKEVTESWHRLLVELKKEIECVSEKGSDIFPTIHFDQLDEPNLWNDFASRLRQRGCAVIQSVVPRAEAAQWKSDLDVYIDKDPRNRLLPTYDTHLYGVYWSPPQIKARAHPNVFKTQRLLMKLWKSSDPEAMVSPNFPIAYADRLRIRNPSDPPCSIGIYVDGGSVERWEPDGYGLGSTFDSIWKGRWEKYDPWESSSRLKVNSDLYNSDGICTVFRMLQGWLSLSTIPPHESPLSLCPMFRLTTAYLLLRPFFIPLENTPSHPDFLSPANWVLEWPPSSNIHGALPSYPQELNDALHPHLQLHRSLTPPPQLNPGDYLIWHPDGVYALDRATYPDRPSIATLYLPASPLTPANALYLSHQRKTFLSGESTPDFSKPNGETVPCSREFRVQQVSNAGGDEGLRAMGLLPWDEDEATNEMEERLLEVSNGILFPERFD